MKMEDMGNSEIQKELGNRLQRERLNQNITQAALAESAGISRRTLVAAEKGQGTTLETLINILRALGRLGQLDQFLPEPPISPIELAKLKGKVRRKASGKTHDPCPNNQTWMWKEDEGK
jgi:transcriptional regulator with XRE-family HTH domain